MSRHYNARVRRDHLSKNPKSPRLHRCHYCGKPLLEDGLTLDHKIAQNQGGDSSHANIVKACRDCNMLKGSSDYAAFKAWKLPEKQARLAGLPVPELGRRPNAPTSLKTSRVKITPARLAALRAFAGGAVCLPAGDLIEAGKRLGGCSPETTRIFEQRGWIERCAPPAAWSVVYVWRITDSGRVALERIESRSCTR